MQTTFVPVTLDEAPEVNALLGRLGLGGLDAGVDSAIGRSDNWRGTTSTGVPVFVKRVLGGPELAPRQLRRSLAFEAVVRQAADDELCTPTVLGHDAKHSVLVTELLANAQNGTQLALREAFGEELAERVGRALALLHTAGANAVELDTTSPSLPRVDWNEALPLELYTNLTFAEMHLWRILHADDSLCAAIARLREWEATAATCPAHCDLRLDQLLLSDGKLHLIDGEEFRLADPARDVGSFAGEWLHLALGGLSDAARTTANTSDSTHRELLASGTRELTRLRPHVAAFWAGYRASGAPVTTELAVRATAFAGWHLIDRALSTAEHHSRLPATTRAAMGVGRGALLRPEQFVITLGLGEGI